MKKRERFIVVAVALVLVAAVTYFSTRLWVSASEPTAPESQTNPRVEATQPANQLKAGQQRIAELEKELDSLRMEDRSDFPGLHTALKNMKLIVIEVKDLPLEAVRYGLSNKNIIDAVKARLRTHGIRAVTFDEGLSSANAEDLRTVSATPSLHPRLEVGVEFAPRGATYIGYLGVSMRKRTGAGLDNDGGSPEVAKAARELSKAVDAMDRPFEDTKGKEGDAKEQALKAEDAALNKVVDLRAKWVQAVKQVERDFIDGRPPRKPIRQWTFVSCWEYRLSICGALANFAEDERNGLDEMIDYFAREFLKANPIEAKQ
ncbi:MAG TPA: hypothetical protein PLU87_16635 [Sedimentisphaerales bacterium]|nr:hypothetical protein [Sedimentisphaerales bacterium]HRS12646.1 hypothetical protein [Sedimentisphaerales bacterium]HRV48076.1 hypothetical protein [Sedimentisphaerales bacterium]